MSLTRKFHFIFCLFFILGGIACSRRQEAIIDAELTFGNSSTFASIRSIATDSKDNVYVLDSRACNIKVFDSTGGIIKTLGRKGQGPGEIYVPAAMEINKRDEIITYDPGNHRINRFSTDGELLGEISTSKYPRLGSISYIDEDVFIGSSSYYGEKRIEELAIFDNKMEKKAVIATLENKIEGRVN